MAIAIAESPTNGVSGGTSCAVTLSAATEGHTLIAIMILRADIDWAISGSGWTLNEDSSGLGAGAIRVWSKVAGASEPTTVTFSGASSTGLGTVIRLTGAHATTPFVNDSGATEGADDAPIPGTFGGSGTDLALAVIYLVGGTGLTVSNWDGYTEQVLYDPGSPGDILAVGYKASTASEGPTFTLDASATWIAYGMGIDAAAAGTLLLRRRREML